jgi:hypothetical protein
MSRNFALLGGPCTGIPGGVNAYSLNITVTNTLGAGFIKMYPQGGSVPVVSTLNYVAGQTVANAAIVPAGTGGGITVVAGVSGTDLIIDINGYFPGSFENANRQFLIATSFSGSCIICADNFASGPGSSAAFFDESSAANNTNGVLGANGSTSFQGSFLPGPEGVTGINAFSGVLGIAMDRAVVGVLLDSAGNDLAEGRAGKSGSSATNFYGLEGILFSTAAANGSAGVLGVETTGFPTTLTGYTNSGVLGVTQNGIGVEGLSRYIGILGGLYDSTGAFLAYGFLGSNLGTAADLTAPPWGVFAVGNLGATGSKHFVEPHPSDATKVIVYSSIEGRTVDTYFRGSGQFVEHQAVIEVPEDFRIVTAEEGLTVQLTSVGGFAQMYVESQDLSRIVVKSSKDVQFNYLIQGLRRTYRDVQPVRTGYEFMPRSPTDTLPASFPEETRRRLIANGTYNSNGTVNMETAERLGWTRIWQQRENEDRAAARENVALSSDRSNK